MTVRRSERPTAHRGPRRRTLATGACNRVTSWTHTREWTPAHAAMIESEYLGSSLAPLAPSASGLALIALLVAVHGLWLAQVLLISLLLVVPGVVLLRALRVPGTAIAAFPVYIPAASLVVLIGSGLGVNWIGLLLGMTAPIRAGPLLIGLELVCFSLLASSVRAPNTVTIPWHWLSGRVNLVWPLVIPLIAAFGAMRLNDGHGSTVAFAGVVAGVALLVWAMPLASRLDPVCLAMILYAVGLAIMWSFSLRSTFVYGFDIASEYHAMNQTVVAGAWHTYHPGDAYGAMLSITLLPAELHALSAMSGLLLFKIVYPMLFALFPVAIFGLAHKVLPRCWAFIAAAFVVAQSTFAQELPALARQEIALLLFIAFVAAMLNTQLPKSVQWPLVSLFGVVMAVSHYSTTYLAIGMTLLLLLLQWAASWIRPVPRITGAVAIGFIAATASAALWYVPVTHSSSDITRFVDTLQTQGLDLLPNQSQTGNLISSYLNGNAVTPVNASRYAQLVRQEYEKGRPFVVPFPDASSPLYALHDSSPPTTVRLHPVATVLGIAELLVQQLANLLAAIGAIQIVLRRRSTSLIARQVGLFALATLSGLAIIRLSGTVASEYNQERALIQSLFFLSITLSWSMVGLGGLSRGRQKVVLTAAAAAIALMFMYTGGIISALLGGGESVNLANSGEAFERFYMTAPELASASWLGDHFTNGQLVYADEYGQLRLHAETGIANGLLTDITPMTLNQYAWIYASRTNIVDRRARGFYQQELATYVFPLRFIEKHYNIVYTDGTSEVFHR